MKDGIWFSLRKTLWIVPYVVMFSLVDIFLARPGSGVLADVLWYSVWGRISSGEMQTIVLSLKCIGGIFLFAILFGREMAGYFDTVSTVYFTRIASRGSFVLGKAGRICVLASAYVGWFLSMEFWIGIRQVADWHIGGYTVYVLFLLGGILGTLLMLVCLAVNWLSVRLHVTVAVFLVFTCVMALEYVGILFFDNPVNVVLNPLCANYRIVEDVGLACGKLAANGCYLGMLVLGIRFHICRMDIF